MPFRAAPATAPRATTCGHGTVGYTLVATWRTRTCIYNAEHADTLRCAASSSLCGRAVRGPPAVAYAAYPLAAAAAKALRGNAACARYAVHSSGSLSLRVYRCRLPGERPSYPVFLLPLAQRTSTAIASLSRLKRAATRAGQTQHHTHAACFLPRLLVLDAAWFCLCNNKTTRDACTLRRLTALLLYAALRAVLYSLHYSLHAL